MIKCSFVLFVLLSLTGCWSAFELQNHYFITALGVDFQDEEYIVYAQVASFENIARQESGNTSQGGMVYVAKASGKSVDEAMNQIFRASQHRLQFGHVNAFIFGEGALKKPILEYLDILTRYREFRYSIWVYGTKERIEDVLSTVPFLTMTPASSILGDPEGSYEQASFLPPIEFYRFLAQFHEPGQTTYLPEISINKDVWSENNQSQPLLEINGAFFIYNYQLQGYLSNSMLEGFQWLQKLTVRSPLILYNKNDKVVSTYVHQPQFSIKSELINNKVYYAISLKAAISVRHLSITFPTHQFKQMAEKQLMEDIRKVYKIGIEKNIDVFQLEHYFYRSHPRDWHRLKDRKSAFLHEDALQFIDVEVDIRYTGKYKYIDGS